MSFVQSVLFAASLIGSVETTPFQVPPRLDTVLFDGDEAGTIVARSGAWKLVATRSAVTWMPVLGATAPRAPRLELRVVGATRGEVALPHAADATPARDGSRITYVREAWLEHYDLSVDAVEQSFEFAQLAGDGDLELVLATGTELAYLGRDHGLRFDADGRAQVRYGDVTVVDADGRRTSLQSTWRDGAIVLRVPDAVLDAARFPIVVDPLIDTFDVDADTGSDRDPAIASTQGSFLIVYEDATSVNDRDILARRYDLDGVLLETVSADISTADTYDPAVAGTGTNFMQAWIHTSSGTADPIVRARRRVATSTVQGPAFDVTPGSTGEANVDVGASPNPVSFPFIVVWDEQGLSRNVLGRGINAAGGLAPTLPIGASLNHEIGPRISSNAGANGIWVTVWDETTPSDQRVVYRAIRDDGTFATTAQAAHLGPIGVERRPDIDGDGLNWVMVYERLDPNAAGARDIGAGHVRFDPAIAPLVFFEDFDVNLTKLELGAGESQTQSHPIVATEGSRVTYAYLGTTSSAQVFPSLRTATFVLDPIDGNTFDFIESNGLVALGLAVTPHSAAITATRFEKPGLTAIAWEQPVSGNPDVYGQIRSGLANGGVTTVQTGCGSPEPLLALTGTPAIGATLTMTPIGAVSPLFVIGLPMSAPLCPGQSGCVLGATPLILLPAPFGLAGPIPAEPELVGFTIAVQIIDLLPAAVPGACGPPFHAQTFRVSDTRRITFQ